MTSIGLAAAGYCDAEDLQRFQYRISFVVGAAVQKQRWTYRPWTTVTTSTGRLRPPSVVNHPLQPYDHQPNQIHKLQETIPLRTRGQYRVIIRTTKQAATLAIGLLSCLGEEEAAKMIPFSQRCPQRARPAAGQEERQSIRLPFTLWRKGSSI